MKYVGPHGFPPTSRVLFDSICRLLQTAGQARDVLKRIVFTFQSFNLDLAAIILPFVIRWVRC